MIRVSVSTVELATLIRHSAVSGEAITGLIPSGDLDLERCGPQTIRKLAELRGLATEEE